MCQGISSSPDKDYRCSRNIALEKKVLVSDLTTPITLYVNVELFHLKGDFPLLLPFHMFKYLLLCCNSCKKNLTF